MTDGAASDRQSPPSRARIAPYAVGAIVMALAATAPGWFLWKHYTPLALAFLGAGGVFGAVFVGGALASGRGLGRTALGGALAALASYPVIGFAVGLGEACLRDPNADACLSIARGGERMWTLIRDEAMVSAPPVALFGALAGVCAALIWRAAAPLFAPGRSV